MDECEMDFRKGGTTFGIKNAVKKAQKAAGDKGIRISGGADTLQQFLNTGFLNKGIIHLPPVLLGECVQFFKHLDTGKVSVNIEEVRDSSGVTHLFCKSNK